MKKPFISFVGHSGCGKTSIIIGLISHLRKKGYKVGAVKHTHHNFSVDYPGKDSYRFYRAGAQRILIASDRKGVFIEYMNSIDSNFDFDKYFSDVDIVIGEGFKKKGIPKIEVVRKSVSADLLCPENDLMAVVSDFKIKGIKNFSFKDLSVLAEFLEETFLKR
ncbi:MAG: molybdopterin-guanine dinucleotide biosynthesis protein B [Fidelibacterota bacterium]